MKCSSNKIGYFSISEVQEALIRSHINFHKAAVNYYQCHDCGNYHLTSNGEKHNLLSDAEVIKRIQKERLEQEWNQRFKR